MMLIILLACWTVCLIVILLIFFFLAIKVNTSIQKNNTFNNSYTQYISLDDKKSVIQKLRELHPKNFEEFISLVFQLSWYEVIYKSQWKKMFGKRYARKDWWIDLICKKEEKRNFIQIKKLVNQEVSVKTIREMWWVCGDEIHWNDNVIVITTSLFSQDAERFASQKHIILIDYKTLLETIDKIINVPKNKTTIESFLNDPNLIDNKGFATYIKICPLCLAPLVKRKWWFYGCMNYYKKNCQYREKISFTNYYKKNYKYTDETTLPF